MHEQVLLTTGDKYDKVKAHQMGMEHYAISILIFNHKGELLLQKRAKSKYHSGGLWTNTCCTHPLSADFISIKRTAKDRLEYEMGIDCKNLMPLFSFHYKEKCNSMIENEYDYVFVGHSDSEPIINKDEVCDYKWDNIRHINLDRLTHPGKFTKWFHIIMNNIDIIYKEKTDALKKV